MRLGALLALLTETLLVLVLLTTLAEALLVLLLTLLTLLGITPSLLAVAKHTGITMIRRCIPEPGLRPVELNFFFLSIEVQFMKRDTIVVTAESHNATRGDDCAQHFTGVKVDIELFHLPDVFSIDSDHFRSDDV